MTCGPPRLKPRYGDIIGGSNCAESIKNSLGIAAHITRHANHGATGTWQSERQLPRPKSVPKAPVMRAKRWVAVRTQARNERVCRLVVHYESSDWMPVAWAWLTEARIPTTIPEAT